MKITLVVLFLTGLTIYCKCAAVLSLPPSLISHAASLNENPKTQKPFTANDNESQQRLLPKEDGDEMNEQTLVADLYTNFKNLWHNDLSLNLQKREERNNFENDIDYIAAMQQQKTKATIKKNNQNHNGLQLNDNKNVGRKHYNHNNNKNENNIWKSSLASSVPLSRSSASSNLNEATKLNLNIQPQLQFPPQNLGMTEEFEDTDEWLPSSPERMDDIFVSPPHQIQETLHLKRRELENVPVAAAAATTEDSPVFNRFFKSKKYWSKQCPLENEYNCLQEHYGAFIADRNNALLKQLHYKQTNPFSGSEKFSSLHQSHDNEDDIVILLTAEKKLIQFLDWALSQLYPYKFINVTDNGAYSYHPAKNTGKKLNLSGRLEPTLLVDEPHYLIVRRDYDQDEYNEDNDYKRSLHYGEDPFIPPRGRKHNLPDLDSLLQRYETFVPNRGRRDKIKDIFKHDDLFYPNRGRRQMTSSANDNGITAERSDNTDIDDVKVNQHYYINEPNAERHEMQYLLLLSNELMEYLENFMAEMKRNIQKPKQTPANIFDEMSKVKEPTKRMSTTFQQAPVSASPLLLKKRLKSMTNILHSRKKPYNYNARLKWWKRYTAAKTSLTQPANSSDRQTPAIRSPTMATNRLQTTLRSMSPLQQLTQLYQQLPDHSPPHLRPENKFMWQQQQTSLKPLAQQFDPLSWHKLQLLLQLHEQQQQILQQYLHRHYQPILTMRHPRLTALQHLPTMQQQQLQLATPRKTQLTYSADQLNDNSITNDLDNLYNKDLD